MSINGADLARMTDEEIRRMFPQEKCVICGKPIDENDPHPPQPCSRSDYSERPSREEGKSPTYHPK